MTRSRYLLRVEFYRTALSLARRGGTKIVPIVLVSAYRDGEVLDLPGRPRTIHVPGHTPGTPHCSWKDAGSCSVATRR